MAAKQALDLFVYSLPWTACKEVLVKHFAKFGPVVDAHVVYDWSTGLSKGYGFVTMESFDSMKKAMAYKYHTIDGREVRIKMSTPNSTLPEEQKGRLDNTPSRTVDPDDSIN
ncbi:hypothetical protein EMCRGX_G032580 [Ephydatia muelleri]